MALTDLHSPSGYAKEADIEGGGPAGKARDRYSGHNYQRNSVTMLATAFGGEFPPAPVAPAPRKFADPAPLGLCAFALTTFLLSLVNIQAAGVTKANVVVGLFFAYGGVVQLLAGMWEMAIGSKASPSFSSSFREISVLTELGRYLCSNGFWVFWWLLDQSCHDRHVGESQQLRHS